MTAHRHEDGHEHVHGPDGEHEHVQDHEHGPLELITHVQGGAPALDIGGDIGALSVLLDDDELGTELYLRRADDSAFSIHTGVWKRDVGSGRVVAALFCELVMGSYWVLDPAGADRCAVRIEGGQLSELDLRRSAS